jgi:hypothetical protein
MTAIATVIVLISLFSVFVFVNVNTVSAASSQITHEDFEKCFKKYAPIMDKLLSKKTKQFVENKIRSGGTLDISNITNNDNVYLCVHKLPTHPSINLDTAKTYTPIY